MKVHCCNILLFSLILNTLLLSSSQVNVHRKHYSIALHTSKTPKLIKSNRSLCECDIYKPNYDDPEMKNLMENFNKQTQQRFHEYDEHINDKRQKCKEQREKDIKNIILKDKIEKELTEKLSALQTDIQSDAIPTCVCEKSLADKVEKGCLRCGSILGSAMPELGSIGGSLLYALSKWQTTEIATAIAAAQKAGIDAATQAGIEAVKFEIRKLLVASPNDPGLVDLTKIVTPSTYNNGAILHKSAIKLANTSCDFEGTAKNTSFCSTILRGKDTNFRLYAETGVKVYNETLPTKTAAFETKYIDGVNTAYGGYQTSIIASIVAIVVIVLIMIIIYLILRYRRKKKMKKKLQYIKLLEE
ncbi:rifin [Plasmodium falciparum NF54]|uniref:Rifin n=2 Tax=Plasmodium falciparum TaxID=5833 RepID=A0A143ZVI1_PLAF7|nr:rifin [Plasmodium falciparum 3D7]EWC88795.1 hypothetical protein PFNF54_02415 [Plasmodium falciparum NF54]KAF4326773.1 rifin [Plasmodium falciparum NF54]PKC42150.1 rifin [Plasmodium falciparum NF54]CZT62655.1 rifin [Plasmodium falciparum 3D7]|eukprot:XP_024329035.1 rifin [Plasmodium falciparum 3D7]